MGAMLFGVTAPRSLRPALGAMSGWDENFDKKFDSATKIDVGGLVPGDPYDPFGCTSGGMSSGGFGADEAFGSSSFIPPAAPQSTPAFGRKADNDFGQGSMADNPFLSMVAAEANAASGDGETPDDGPLFDDDTSQPLEPFPRLTYDGEGWEMFIRSPPKKKLTSHRYNIPSWFSIRSHSSLRLRSQMSSLRKVPNPLNDIKQLGGVECLCM